MENCSCGLFSQIFTIQKQQQHTLLSVYHNRPKPIYLFHTHPLNHLDQISHNTHGSNLGTSSVYISKSAFSSFPKSFTNRKKGRRNGEKNKLTQHPEQQAVQNHTSPSKRQTNSHSPSAQQTDSPSRPAPF